MRTVLCDLTLVSIGTFVRLLWSVVCGRLFVEGAMWRVVCCALCGGWE